LTFESLGLTADLLQTVADEGYTEPTPVQAAAIPFVLEGRDVLAAAQTGTGKTAAFTLPILDRLRTLANDSFSPARHPVRALILVPTRELAMQVDASVRTYGRTVPLRSAVVYAPSSQLRLTALSILTQQFRAAVPNVVADAIESEKDAKTLEWHIRLLALSRDARAIPAMGSTTP